MEILEGRFRVLKRLGNGAFGEIYKVEKKKDADVIACLKICGYDALLAKHTLGVANGGAFDNG